MVREIMRDINFLSQKAELASKDDLPAAENLLETLSLHKDVCVGILMALTSVVQWFSAV